MNSATSHPKVARPPAVASNPETLEPVLLARRADREPSTINMMRMNLRSKSSLITTQSDDLTP